MTGNSSPLRNPYTAGRPVVGKSFFGRDTIFQSLNAALVMSRQRVAVLHGQRRIGKSSILQELPEKLPKDQFIIVNFDLQFYAGQDLPTVLHALAETISMTVGFPPQPLEKFKADTNYFETLFLEMISSISSLDKRLLILIDEFDITREIENKRVPVATPQFTNILRRLIDSDYPLHFLLVAGSNLEKLAGYMQSVTKGGIAIRVDFFDQAETTSLIKNPVQDIFSYEQSAIDAVFELSSGHPYFTQLLCWEIFNRAAPQGKTAINVEDVIAAKRKALISGMGAFFWIWNELSMAERVYLSAVALTISRKKSETILYEENYYEICWVYAHSGKDKPPG